MTDKHEVPANCVERLSKMRMDKTESNLVLSRKTELNLDGGEFSLMRTTDDVSLRITGIKGNRKASTVINKTDEDSLAEALRELENLVESGEEDPAVDIAEFQPRENFARGSEVPEVDLMYSRLQDFLNRSRRKYPSLILEQVILDHTLKNRYFANSNGVRFSSRRGIYNFVAMFTAKEGENISSFNYSAVSSEELERNLWEMGTVDMLMEQSCDQTVTGEIPETFTGDVIVTPDCLTDFIDTVAEYLTDHAMITGTSIYRDSLGERIADERLSLHSMPLSGDLAGGYFITPDGFKASNSTIIDRGVLNTFLLSLYGSRKTGRERAVNSGSFYVMDPGDTGFDDMVRATDRGLLLCRFSGGRPSSNGDFSGVAKNSYYIENGEIKHPVSETMVAGNVRDMLHSVKSISSERINNGFNIFPWVTFTGITVSGK